MKVIKIKTPYDCLVISGQEKQLLCSNETLILDREEKLLIYPIDKSNNIPFAINLNSLSPNTFYDYINIEEECVIFLLNGALCQNYSITTINVNGIDCTFELGEHSLIIKNKNFKRIITLNDLFNKYKIGKDNDICYILLESNNFKTIYLFNAVTGKVKMLCGSQIDMNKGSFTVELASDNIAKENIKCNYEITSQGLEKKQKEFIYVNNFPRIATIDKTVPFAFLEAMKLEDYNLAYSYLSKNLQNEIDLPHLEKYFGEINSFSHIGNFSYLVLSSSSKRIFDFFVEEGKIQEIELKNK